MRSGAGYSNIALAIIMLGLVPSLPAQETLPSAGAVKAADSTPPPSPAPDYSELAQEPVTTSGVCESPQDGRYFFDAEYLLLQPHRRALDFAISDPNRNGLAQGSVESVFPDSASGVRIGGGVKVGDRGWAVRSYYTYFYSASTRTVVEPPGGTLYATLTHPGIIDAVDTAVGDYRLKYNLLDVELGKTLVFSDTFSLWLSAGGRFAWINQALNASYDGQTAFEARVSSPIDFEGAGLRIGGEGRWAIAYGFGLYARGYGSLLTGAFHTNLTETNNAGAAQITNIAENFRKVVPVTELGLGLTWQWQNVTTSIGYQMVNWYGLVDSPDIVHDFSNKLSHRLGDLSLDGLAVRLQVGY